MSQDQEGPAVVRIEGGKVLERKPDGTEVRMSPADAVETAQRLLEVASRVEGEDQLARGK